MVGRSDMRSPSYFGIQQKKRELTLIALWLLDIPRRSQIWEYRNVLCLWDKANTAFQEMHC